MTSHIARIREFQKSLRKFLVTTRFNNHTWNENIAYRQRFSKIGCIYPTPQANSQSIPNEAILYVLEMNNDTNQIMGIGLIRNHAYIQQHRVYSEPNYNRYAYLGKMRIDRQDMSEEEERIMKVFDILCFRGSRHMKRLLGIKSFPVDILYRCKPIVDFVDFIGKMFEKRMVETNKA